MLRVGWLVLFAFVTLVPGVRAQELLDAPVEDLVAGEEIRSAVETAIENYLAARGAARIDVALEGIQSLLPYGDEIVPYLANELEQENYETYDFATYALGFLDTPAAAATLREAIERAEATPGAASMARKAWACWALGLHRELDALKLVNEGNHQSGKFPMHAQTTVLETIAVQTAPESVPVLLEQLEAWGESELLRGDRRYVLRSLRRVADPSVGPVLAKIIDESDEPAQRAQSADALRSIATPISRAALLEALQDSEPGVRRAAAFALKWMDRPGKVGDLLERLEEEEDLRVREGLYQVIAANVPPEQLPRLLAQWNQSDPLDRRNFIVAIAPLTGEGVTRVLLEAVDDPDKRVAMTAVAPLAGTGTKAAMDRLLELARTSERWGVLQNVAKAAGAQGIRSLAPELTQRLLSITQMNPQASSYVLPTYDRLAQALVDLRYMAARSKLRRARKTVVDSEMAAALDKTIEALELLRKNGKDLSLWMPLLRDADPDRSRLARDRIAELGGAKAATALVDAYDDLDRRARVDTLRKLEGMDSPAVRELLRRLLLEPESYVVEREGERMQAAWNARRIGGQEMLELLAAAVRLRDGRDVRPLIYLAAMGGQEALPLLREYRLSRLRYLGLERGHEQEVLDWIVRRLENDLSIERYDQSPQRLLVR